MMVTFESLFTSWLYRRESETKLLAGLGVAARWVLLLYLVVKLGDLGVRGKWNLLFSSGSFSLLFWFEMTLSALLPLVLLFISKVRRSNRGQWVVAISGVTGFVLNRISVGGLGQIKTDAPFYIPAWSEVALSAGVVAGAALVFLFAVEQLQVWEQKPTRIASVFDLKGWRRALRALPFWKFKERLSFDGSMSFVLAAGLGFAMISGETATNRGVEPTTVRRARGADTLWIDGNIDGFGAVFTHRSHMRGCFRGPECANCHDAEPVLPGGRHMGDSASDPTCARCHHMNLPRDRNTACATCHRDMYGPTDAFGHNWHGSPSGAGLSCKDCHPPGEVRTAANGKKCVSCHSDLVPPGSTIQFTNYQAPGYVEAMHTLCIGCHHVKDDIVENPNLARCATCHPGQRDFVDAADIATRSRRPMGKRVLLPLLKEK